MSRRRVALLLIVAALASGSPRWARAAAPEAVTIMRDAWGVPHVFGDVPRSLERGAYAAGYAQAQDRLFQMDILRRAATGRLAEMLGPDYLEMDRVVRRDGFTAAERERFLRRLSSRDRRAVEAYRDGVNAWIEQVTLDATKLPFEFVGQPPAPWAVGDTVAIAGLEITIFGARGGQEVLNADLLLDLLDRFPDTEARGIFDDLFWVDDPAAPTTIAAGEAGVTDRDRIERFAASQLELVRTQAATIRRAAAALRAEQGILGGLGARSGIPVPLHRHASNAIVIGPALSASGHAILLGGPQTGLNAPSFFWEIGLHGASYEAEGVNAPIGPGVLIGRGRSFAMTITSGILDNVDTFVELLDPKDPGRYVFRGRSRRS
jgi:penicillin amidase